MNLFLSHAISDKSLATSIKKLIQETSMGLIDVWQSSSIDGLKPGEVLWDEVHDQLSKSEKILTLITPNSIDRPWLTYESGFVAGKRGAQVVPILFGIRKNELPSPLSAYVVYYGHDANDLQTLLMQIISVVAPNPSAMFVESLTNKFLEDVSAEIDSLNRAWENKRKPGSSDGSQGINYISKLDASELFHKKLSDPKSNLVQLLTYT